MPSDEMLSRYAEVAIQVGLGIEPGDGLLIQAPYGVEHLTVLLVEEAYRAGAVNVDVLWNHPGTDRARFEHGLDEAIDVVTPMTEYVAQSFEAGTASLYILAQDPDALAGADVGRVQRFSRRNRERLVAARRHQMSGTVPWAVIAAPVSGWTASVFPGDEDGTERLWDAIFAACRIDEADPVAAWQEHARGLVARAQHLTARSFVGLRYEGPGTEITFGLPDGVRWEGGGVGGPGKRTFIPNIPTEEVFTVPHRLRADGHIRATKPLSYFGQRIDGFEFEVSDGRVVSATAETGQDALDRILETDDGSVRFGELAMVPQSSAVAAQRLVWNNMLYDENDACHIALGMSYPTCVHGGTEMTPEDRLEAGLNHSALHVDFVVGSSDLDVFGVDAAGAEHPIIVGGEWAFEV